MPAFGAGRCIQTVATILVEQDYPRARWRGVLVSDESEDEAAVERSRAAATDIQEGIRAQVPPESLPVSEAALVLYLSDRATTEYLLAKRHNVEEGKSTKTPQEFLAKRVSTYDEAALCRILLEISLLDSACIRSGASDDLLTDIAKEYRVNVEKP